MKTFILLLAVILSSNAAWSDITMHYELHNSEGEKTQVQISTHMIWAKIIDTSTKNTSLLFKAGHLFPLYQLNHSEQSYRELTPEVKTYLRIDEDHNEHQVLFSYPEMTLKPTRKQVVINGVKCRIVHEMINGEPKIEHCIANSARAGLTVRDTKTLIRTYNILRKYRASGWLGAGTSDEKYLSIRSRDLSSSQSLLLKEISTDYLGPAELRIPKEYKLVKNFDQ